jgi:hypothetical protein
MYLIGNFLLSSKIKKQIKNAYNFVYFSSE